MLKELNLSSPLLPWQNLNKNEILLINLLFTNKYIINFFLKLVKNLKGVNLQKVF